MVPAYAFPSHFSLTPPPCLHGSFIWKLSLTSDLTLGVISSKKPFLPFLCHQAAPLSFSTSCSQLYVSGKHRIILFDTASPRELAAIVFWDPRESSVILEKDVKVSIFRAKKKYYTLHTISQRLIQEGRRVSIPKWTSSSWNYSTVSLSSIRPEQPTFGLLT